MKNSAKYIMASIMLLAGVCLTGCDKEAKPKAATQETKTVVQFVEAMPAQLEKLPLSLGGGCNMDTINGTSWGVEPHSASQKDTVTIGGWGLDNQKKQLPSSIFIRVKSGDRNFYTEAKAKTQRIDVAEYFKEDYYKDAGYQADVSLSALPPGDYQAMIVMAFPDKSILCANGRTLRVK